MATELNVLTDRADEQGSYVIDCACIDEDEAPVIPTAFAWSLSRRDGTIVNSRDAVAVTGGDLAETVNVLLEADDLSIDASEPDDDEVERFLTVEWEYTSTLGGADTPQVNLVMFFVKRGVISYA